jgi:uncharacterized protein
VAATRQKTKHDDTDGPIAGNGEGQVRMCAVTRAELPPTELIRFVRGPDGAIVPDLEHRLPGRGVWLSCNRLILEKAVKTKAFARSLHADVSVSPDLPERIDVMLVRRACDTLALANKAGLVLAGFDKVDGALEKGVVTLLMHGSDAAADGRGKLDRKFTAIRREKGLEAQIIDNLTIEQMSLAMGRPSVVHAALIPGGLAKRFRREAARVTRYRSTSVTDQALSGQALSGQALSGQTSDVPEIETTTRNEG